MSQPFSNIRVTLPSGYDSAAADRLREAFPGVHVVMEGANFAIEEENEAEAPSDALKAIYAWVDANL
jgi:hypothetical protein